MVLSARGSDERAQAAVVEAEARAEEETKETRVHGEAPYGREAA